MIEKRLEVQAHQGPQAGCGGSVFRISLGQELFEGRLVFDR
jgi:hypothetical protein